MDAPYGQHDILNGISKDAVPFAIETVFSELPLLKYSISRHQDHLHDAEEAHVKQSHLLDIYLREGPQAFMLWHAFQDVVQLPSKYKLGQRWEHRLIGIDWSDFLQVMVALGLGSCVREFSDRILRRELRVQPKWDLRKSLFVAVSSGSTGIALDVILCGADPNKRDPNGFSPLEDACIRGDRMMVDVLIRSGAKVNT